MVKLTYHPLLNSFQAKTFVQQRKTQRKPDFSFPNLFLVIIQLQNYARYQLSNVEYGWKEIVFIGLVKKQKC